jgi:hypothetical protein
MAEGRARTVRDRDLVDVVAIASITGADTGASGEADVDAGVDCTGEEVSVQVAERSNELSGEQRGDAARGERGSMAILTTLVQSCTGAFELSNVGVGAEVVGGEVGVGGSAETVVVRVATILPIKGCSGIVSAIRVALCLRIIAANVVGLCGRRRQPKRAGPRKELFCTRIEVIEGLIRVAIRNAHFPEQ